MATMESKLVLSLVDKLTGPAKGIGGALDDIEAAAKAAGKGASKEMQGLGKSLQEAREQANKFDLFDKLRKDLPGARQAFRQAQGDVEKLAKELNDARKAAAKFDGVKTFQKNGPIAREMADAKKKVQELERQLTTAQRAVSRTSDAFEKQSRAVIEAKNALQGMGVNLKSVGSAQAALKGKIDTTTSAIKRQMVAEEQSAKRREKYARAYQTLAATGAGAIMAGQMLARPTGKAMTYDEQITYMASTMAGGGTLDERRAAKGKISDAIDAALKDGGGSREGAATALNSLIASGAFKDDEALAALSSVTRTSHAAGAREEDVAQAAIAMRNNGVAVEDLQKGFDIMFRGGQLGSFELRDMAKWFPQQMAMARGAGLTGLKAVSELSSLNQVSRGTAGSADEAGNNLVNLLQKLNSRELQDTMGKVVTPQAGDPSIPGKVTGKGKRRKVAPAEFDWQGYLIQRQKAGVNPIEALGEIIERQFEWNGRYQDLKKGIANAKTPEDAKALLESATSIAEGSEVGKIFADRQALMAALSILYGKDKKKGIDAELLKADGTVQAESEFVREQTWSKAQDAKNTIDRANENAYGAVSGPLGTLTEAINEAARDFPNLTAGLYAATEILMAIGGAGIVSGAVGGVLAGKAAGAAAAGGVGSGAATTATAAVAGLAGRAVGALAGAAAIPAVIVTGVGSTSPQEDAVLRTADEITKAMRAKYGDEVVSAARSQNRPWWRASSLAASDSQDPEYIRKYLESPEGQAYLAKAAPKATSEPPPNLPAAPLPPQHPQRAPMPPQSPTLDSITSEWPEAARKSLADYVRAIAQGGVDAKAEATRVGEAIQQELSVTGTPKINTAELDIAISKAQQLGNALRNIPGVVAPSSGKPPEGRAKGGPVAGGTPYIVGERGPEMFVPRSSGSILTAARTADMFQPRSAPKRTGGGQSGNSGPASITFGDINIQGGANATPQQIRREFSREASLLMRRHFSDGIT